MTYLLVALAALMFGLYNVFIKLSADHIQAVLGAVVLQFVAAFLGLGMLAYLRLATTTPLTVSSRGLLLSALAGVAIGLVEIVSFVIYGRGMPVAVGNPLIVGGSLLVTTGVGYVLLREHLNPVQLAAVGLVFAGISLLAWSSTR
ncbi:MAG TPA: EamA family transporter [Gemmatimonadales bacterium]